LVSLLYAYSRSMARGGHARFHAQPDRRADDEDVGRHDPFVDAGPVVEVVAELGRVLDHPEPDAMIEHVDQVDGDPFGTHDPTDSGQQPASV
jgi:hypothetical protein